MANRVQIFRTPTTGVAPAAGARQPGELWVNFADFQAGFIDASKNAQKLVAVRFFATTANYATGDIVIQAGAIYVAKAAITAGAFNATQWTKIAQTTDIPAVYVLPIATTTVLGGVKPDGVTTKVDAGGVLTSAGLVAVATTPPSSPQNGALWFDLIGGQLYAYVNDGSSSQWVIAVNQNITGGVYLPLAGGTLTGALKVPANVGGDGLQIDSVVGNGLGISGQRNGSLRWRIVLGSSLAETGGNAGSDFVISNWTDAGVSSGFNPLYISRAYGNVQIYGTPLNDNAAAGYVGEVISSVVVGPGPTIPTTSVASNVSSVALTAGDWDISGELWVAFGSGGGIFFNGSISSVSGQLVGSPTMNGSRHGLSATFGAGTTQIMTLGPCRASLAAPATYYLVVMAGWSSGTVTAYGKIWARRAR